MAKTTPDRVVLRANPSPQYKEYPLVAPDVYGVGEITPGMLVETLAGEVRPHSTSTGFSSKIFAVEGLNLDTDSKTLGDIDVNYAVDGTTVLTVHANRGNEIYALLAAGNDVAVDSIVESNGDGYLKAGSTNPVGRVLAAVDNDPGTDSLPVRVRIEVL
jgi:hypothetical protein